MSITNNYTSTGYVPTSTSSVTTTLNASGGSGASSASCASSASEVLASYSLTELMTKFEQGNMTLSEVVQGLKLKNITATTKKDDTYTTVTFKYSNKNYTIRCTNVASASATDSKKATTYSDTSLRTTYKFSTEIINKYFDAVEENTDSTGKSTVTKYVLKPNCGYTTVTSLRNTLFAEAKNKLIMANFLENDFDKDSTSTSALYKVNGGETTLSLTNYTSYANEINAQGSDVNELKQRALNKVIRDFSSGNLMVNQLDTILKSIGVENKSRTTTNGNYEVTFKFEGKDYKITCNTAAAAKGGDDVVVENLYFMEDIQVLKDFGISDKQLENYFTVHNASPNNLIYKGSGNIAQLMSDFAYSSIPNLDNVTEEELDNYLSNFSHYVSEAEIEGLTEDVKKYYTVPIGTYDGETLVALRESFVEEYENYLEESNNYSLSISDFIMSESVKKYEKLEALNKDFGAFETKLHKEFEDKNIAERKVLIESLNDYYNEYSSLLVDFDSRQPDELTIKTIQKTLNTIAEYIDTINLSIVKDNIYPSSSFEYKSDEIQRMIKEQKENGSISESDKAYLQANFSKGSVIGFLKSASNVGDFLSLLYKNNSLWSDENFEIIIKAYTAYWDDYQGKDRIIEICKDLIPEKSIAAHLYDLLPNEGNGYFDYRTHTQETLEEQGLNYSLCGTPILDEVGYPVDIANEGFLCELVSTFKDIATAEEVSQAYNLALMLNPEIKKAVTDLSASRAYTYFEKFISTMEDILLENYRISTTESLTDINLNLKAEKEFDRLEDILYPVLENALLVSNEPFSLNIIEKYVKNILKVESLSNSEKAYCQTLYQEAFATIIQENLELETPTCKEVYNKFYDILDSKAPMQTRSNTTKKQKLSHMPNPLRRRTRNYNADWHNTKYFYADNFTKRTKSGIAHGIVKQGVGYALGSLSNKQGPNDFVGDLIRNMIISGVTAVFPDSDTAASLAGYAAEIIIGGLTSCPQTQILFSIGNIMHAMATGGDKNTIINELVNVAFAFCGPLTKMLKWVPGLKNLSQVVRQVLFDIAEELVNTAITLLLGEDKSSSKSTPIGQNSKNAQSASTDPLSALKSDVDYTDALSKADQMISHEFGQLARSISNISNGVQIGLQVRYPGMRSNVSLSSQEQKLLLDLQQKKEQIKASIENQLKKFKKERDELRGKITVLQLTIGSQKSSEAEKAKARKELDNIAKQDFSRVLSFEIPTHYVLGGLNGGYFTQKTTVALLLDLATFNVTKAVVGSSTWNFNS